MGREMPRVPQPTSRLCRDRTEVSELAPSALTTRQHCLPANPRVTSFPSCSAARHADPCQCASSPGGARAPGMGRRDPALCPAPSSIGLQGIHSFPVSCRVPLQLPTRMPRRDINTRSQARRALARDNGCRGRGGCTLALERSKQGILVGRSSGLGLAAAAQPLGRGTLRSCS